MSSANVIPSAPELYPMNEIHQINAEDFRLKQNIRPTNRALQ